MDPKSIQLIDQCRQGDQVASQELFDRYVSRLIAMVHRRMSSRLNRRVDAEDIVQSAFRSFFAGVDRDQFQFEQSGDLWRLLVVISLNKLRRRVAYHRAAKRGMDNEQSVMMSNDQSRQAFCFEAAATEPLPEAALMVMDEFDQLTADLDSVQIEMIKLRMHGYEMTEIAEQVDRSERTVRRVLEKVRGRWSERLEVLEL
ncbi:RNA polymerase sigma-70 factor, ECF subfamily [Neorhodopirellula lusitana]|uniref:RNA polymerase sigma-70 factor, ECF subfamily n=1 Tax=Neorhodopirellula lusitana TaxID=445327 RepID=A0ABY1QSP5_9BACT|nr:ECF-type sigma factor [Neorhodopirellula lusitana]SMP76519.1 RNA polymerase sigma-70 factor, ECF subfamily [Neorhodopirellula lusitana]